MTENEVLKDLKNYQGILKAKTRINAGVNPEIALDAITRAIEIIQQYRTIGTIDEFKEFRSGDFTENLLNMGYTKGYNKAIDEFVEKLKEQYRHYEETDGEMCEVIYRRIDNVAEQMKGGKNE